MVRADIFLRILWRFLMRAAEFLTRCGAPFELPLKYSTKEEKSSFWEPSRAPDLAKSYGFIREISSQKLRRPTKGIKEKLIINSEHEFIINHPMRYIIYARKSREEEDRQILSIEAQVAELREFAAKEQLEIVASFEEAKTAKEPGRTRFAEMLSMIEKGKADGILSWHPDRLARNSVDGGKVIYMIDRELIKSLKFPTFWFEPTPQGLFMLQIAFGQSKYYVDNLRQNIVRGFRQKLRNGVWPCYAPLGYLNNPRTRGIDLDEKKAPFVLQIFERYAVGNTTLEQLQYGVKALD